MHFFSDLACGGRLLRTNFGQLREASKCLSPFRVISPRGFRIISDQLVFPGPSLLWPHGTGVVTIIVRCILFEKAIAQRRIGPFDDPQQNRCKEQGQDAVHQEIEQKIQSVHYLKASLQFQVTPLELENHRSTTLGGQVFGLL